LVKLALSLELLASKLADSGDEVCGELVGILTLSISMLIYVWQDEKKELTTHRFATARLGYGAGAATAETAKEARRMEDSNFMLTDCYVEVERELKTVRQ
jgi:hypothetical protein